MVKLSETELKKLIKGGETTFRLSFCGLVHIQVMLCFRYNKTLEIKQKSNKMWFYDLWRTGIDASNG
ncbi:MAG: hypothetical protein NVS4B1_14600 [Ktedonobacteraceae bacterium]